MTANRRTKNKKKTKSRYKLSKGHPFPRRAKAPEFPRDMTWMNSGGPIRMRDLKGKFVLLDFWTYCCINCIHILPELKKLEQALSKRACSDRRSLGQIRSRESRQEHCRGDIAL